jgi:arylsulfatase A-like enzyme
VLGRDDSGARRTNLALLDWIDSVEEPFFALVHYNETHLRFHPPAPYDRTFMPRNVTAAQIRSVNQDCNAYIAGAAPMSEEDFVILRALYDGELRYVDMRLKEVADALAAKGKWNNTLFIVTADHGENLGDHGVFRWSCDVRHVCRRDSPSRKSPNRRTYYRPSWSWSASIPPRTFKDDPC